MVFTLFHGAQHRRTAMESNLLSQDFRQTQKFAIPAKAGIPSFQRLTGFPLLRELRKAKVLVDFKPLDGVKPALQLKSVVVNPQFRRPGMSGQPFAPRQYRSNATQCRGSTRRAMDQAGSFLKIVDAQRRRKPGRHQRQP